MPVVHVGAAEMYVSITNVCYGVNVKPVRGLIRRLRTYEMKNSFQTTLKLTTILMQMRVFVANVSHAW